MFRAKSVAILTYLVGELWRRIGDIRKASVWFGSVAGEVNDLQNQQWVIDAAEQQRLNQGVVRLVLPGSKTADRQRRQGPAEYSPGCSAPGRELRTRSARPDAPGPDA